MVERLNQDILSGLERLKGINSLRITKKNLDMPKGCIYIHDITDNTDRTIFTAFVKDDDSGSCSQSEKPFVVWVGDLVGDTQLNRVFSVSRPYKCMCCFFSNNQQLEICASAGNVIGTVKQNGYWRCSGFSVKNEVGETILNIKIKANWDANYDVLFSINKLDGEEVGSIRRGRTVSTTYGFGTTTTKYTYSNTVSINFPRDLDVKMKAAVIGTWFLLVSPFFVGLF